MTTSSVSVVVVTWNGLDLTLRCLDSLDRQRAPGRAVEVLVVDNGSTDGTVEALRERPGVRLVPLGRNTGFAGGVNAGVAASSGDVVVLLNNDAVAEPGLVEQLVAPFDASGAERLGATTGRVALRGRFRPGRAGEAGLVDHAGRTWVRVPDGEVGSERLNSTGNEVTRAANGRDRDWLADAAGPPASVDVFGFNGGCAALSRAALSDVGPFDESLFMYYEDTELSWRLRRRGWTVAHVDGARTVHDHAGSSDATSAFFRDHNERNRLLVALLHAPAPVVARAFARAGVRAVLGPERGRRARALVAVARRAPAALRRRRAVDRTARVPRPVVAALLVAEGPSR
ncbi:glycosyltransferase family 2 protein [Cellulomonas sp. PS-H5]|uniref:glycosyltransferase family 2 protein n=1 Tax=Cellulomonas sp. PS-H5 TaxID=2820400 RepID=UPI001C4FECFA|nr:glycosyltransferase family 2 protein [Cellulomonas sp. PS-H5]MBW0254617.1 glycosyltransferase family 2 protein [Cellulomonas sp. PS-H5]